MATIQSPAIDPSVLVRSASVGTPTNSSVCVGAKRRADQAELSDSTCSSSYSSSLSSEEEKKARLIARQQRNRQSAQISREKKKAHIEQLEQEVQLLRDEKQSWHKREIEQKQQREELEERVVYLDSKVHTLEALLVQFVQQQQQQDMPDTTGQPTTLSQLISSSALPTNLHSGETSCSSTEAASAAPVAASSSTVAQPFFSASSNSTCLPAAKATSTQQNTSCSATCLAPQRVRPYSMRANRTVRAQGLTRRSQQTMAAALPAGSIICSLLGRKLIATDRRNHLQQQNQSSVDRRKRVFRIRLRIPTDRLSMALQMRSNLSHTL